MQRMSVWVREMQRMCLWVRAMQGSMCGCVQCSHLMCECVQCIQCVTQQSRAGCPWQAAGTAPSACRGQQGRSN